MDNHQSQLPDHNKDDDLLRIIRDRFDSAEDYDRANREEALDDLRFLHGDGQWDERDKEQRRRDGRPTLLINRMPQFVRQVTGDLRQNKPSIAVSPVEDGDTKIAEIYTGLIRHIQSISDASIAYITGGENSTRCGMGGWRIKTDFTSDDSFEQDILIEPIADPFAITWDEDAVKATREDAQFCYVTSRMSLAAFRDKYPKAKAEDFQKETRDEWMKNWWDGESVRVAEYWHKEPVEKEIGLLESGEVIDLEGLTKQEIDLLGLERTRKVKSHKVKMYITNGVEILEGPFDWAGDYIPIVPVFGEELHVGERTVRLSLIRYAKDPQRLYNYWQTTAAETIALAPKAPFILTSDQINGFEKLWSRSNTRNIPYLLYNNVPNAPPPQRQQPAQMPAALLQMGAIASDDMKAAIGIYDSSLGERSNETSGVAIRARQQEADVGTNVYIDNVVRAINYTGKLLVNLIPRIYDSERVVRILGEDDGTEQVPINVKMPNGEIKNDLSVGKYDVRVETGPNYTTKRREAVESMMAFAQAVPSSAQIMGDLIAKNSDWPGAQEIADRLRRPLVQGGVIEPNEEEMEEMQNQPPPEPPPEQILDLEKMKAEVEGKHLDNQEKMLAIR